MQSKKDLESWYSKKDPWSYESTLDDIERKKLILSYCPKAEYALDIGAGEGFITKDLPANHIHAIELSDMASARLPEHVERVHKPIVKYDLILATGVFYDQYDWRQMHEWIEQSAIGTVLTSNIKDWENPLPKTPVFELEYKYREYTQRLCLYDYSTT